MLLTRRLPSLPVRLARTYASPALASKSDKASSSSFGYGPLAQAAAEEVTSKWKGTSALGGKTKNYIGGEFTESKADKWLEVRDPVCPARSVARQASRARLTYWQSTQTIVNYVPETTESEFNAAVDAASQAFKTWRTTSIMRRQRVMFEQVCFNLHMSAVVN